jgi:hypothetical protein
MRVTPLFPSQTARASASRARPEASPIRALQAARGPVFRVCWSHSVQFSLLPPAGRPDGRALEAPPGRARHSGARRRPVAARRAPPPGGGRDAAQHVQQARPPARGGGSWAWRPGSRHSGVFDPARQLSARRSTASVHPARQPPARPQKQPRRIHLAPQLSMPPTHDSKSPFKATIKSVTRIVGPKATGETCSVVIQTNGAVPYWEGQSYGVIPPVGTRGGLAGRVAGPASLQHPGNHRRLPAPASPRHRLIMNVRAPTNMHIHALTAQTRTNTRARDTQTQTRKRRAPRSTPRARRCPTACASTRSRRRATATTATARRPRCACGARCTQTRRRVRAARRPGRLGKGAARVAGLL